MIIRQDDPRLVAIRAALLHAVPDLTGHQINAAAMHAMIAVDRLANVAAAQSISGDHETPTNSDRTPTNSDKPRQGAKNRPAINRASTLDLDDNALLNSAQTKARLGNVTDMCLWRWQRDPKMDFPPPVKINKRNFWKLGDLRAWQDRHARPARESS